MSCMSITRRYPAAMLILTACLSAPAAEVKTTPLADAVTAPAKAPHEYRVTLDGALLRLRDNKPAEKKPLHVVVTRLGDAFEADASARSADFNKAGHTARVTGSRIVDGRALVTLEANVGSDRWVKGDPNARYQLILTTEGRDVQGRFTGTFQGRSVKGPVTGTLRGPGWTNAEVSGDTVAVELNLGDKRVNWNNARWAVCDFPAPADLSAWDGLVVTVETDTPRVDVWVDLGLMEDDGSWYTIREAAPLTRRSAKVRIDFADARHAEWIFNAAGTGPGSDGNFDEDFHLDRSAISRLAVGTVNPFGVGTVRFRVRDIRLAKWKTPPSGPAEVTVTGRTLQVNDATTIPGGMFGFHQAGGRDVQVDGLRVGSLRPHRAQGAGSSFVAPPKPELGIDLRVCCNYDRRQQLPRPSWGPDWADKCRAVGRGIGDKAEPYGEAVAIEWWNEPYLDLGRYLERDLAKKADRESAAEGKPVVLHGQPLESMVWVKGDDGKLVPRDPSRFTYWSGRQIGIFYNESFNIVAAEAKKLAPDVQMVGGFGFRWNEDEWAAWEILYKPMIDECIEHLDGVNEHHYQGHTDAMAASYEVLQAYTDAVHGRRLDCYNTETNDLWDAPARGRSAASNQFGGRFRSRRRMIYNLRDILYTVMETPDKAKARAIHALWKGATDQRVPAGQPYQHNDPPVSVALRSAEWKTSLTAGDHTHQAGAGKRVRHVQAAVTLAARRAGRRGRVRYRPGKAHVTIGGKRQSFAPLKLEGLPPADKRVSKGDTETVTLVFELPAEALGRAVTWTPVRKAGRRLHVDGPFKPFEVEPWRAAGIDEGEYYALTFLSDLRGRLVQAESTEENIWTVSSIDEKTGQLVTVVYNDGARPRDVDVALAAPEGTTFDGGMISRLLHDDTGEVGIDRSSLRATGQRCETSLTLPPAGAAKLALRLEGPLPTKANVVRTQAFCKAPASADSPVLHRIGPGEELSLPIDLPAAAADAKRAWVRVVIERCGRGEGSVTVAGNTYDLPAAYTPCNAPYIRQVEIDPGLLAGLKELTFTAAGMEAGNGYLLCMASVVWEN